MRKNQIKSLLHDLINLEDYRNPMHNITIKKRREFDLLTGKNFGEDSLAEFYKEKRKWFLDRIKKLNGNIKDFQEVKFILFGLKEKLTIIYKDQKFEKVMVYENDFYKQASELKKEMKETDAFNIENKEWTKRGDD